VALAQARGLVAVARGPTRSCEDQVPEECATAVLVERSLPLSCVHCVVHIVF